MEIDWQEVERSMNEMREAVVHLLDKTLESSAENGANRTILAALIGSHPAPRALLAEFDRLSAALWANYQLKRSARGPMDDQIEKDHLTKRLAELRARIQDRLTSQN